jgi:CsoR family transcriptional regulator, copper-sensing transcriptional repressor
MPAATSQKKSLSSGADKTTSRSEPETSVALTDSESRADVLNRLRRAEGQLRGIQRMIEEGESCLKVGQQFSAVRKALDSTYLRMTVCFMAQELESRLTPDEEQKADLSAMMKDMETLLARMG